MLQQINNEMEGKKTNEELKGLDPDELITAKTGYEGVNDVRRQILEEAKEGFNNSKSRIRPQTASVDQRKNRHNKDFKMLRELAKLNSDLRGNKPFSPPSRDKEPKITDANWTAAARGMNYIKKGHGTGGGHLPGKDGF